ncbi:hypothetical protein AAFC00_005808 [Neodothiora populina]
MEVPSPSSSPSPPPKLRTFPSASPFNVSSMPSSKTATPTRMPSPENLKKVDTVMSLAPSFNTAAPSASEAKPEPKRRGSLSALVSRATSHEIHTTTRSTSVASGQRSRTMLRKHHKSRDQPQQKPSVSQVPQQAPQIPSPMPMPSLDGFGGVPVTANAGVHDVHNRPDSVAIFSGEFHEAAPPPRKAPVNNFSRPGRATASPPSDSPGTSATYLTSSPSVRTATTVDDAEQIGSYDRTKSITNRGRESYASAALSAGGNVNSPRRVRRRKDPTPFNILVAGASKSGKTSFIEFVKTSMALPEKKRPKGQAAARHPVSSGSAFTPSYVETEIDGERVGLTLWDSKGLQKNIADLQLREITTFIEARFEETFAEEQKVVRSPGAKDTHIHCVLLILDPTRLDANVIRSASSGEEHAPNTLANTMDEELDLQVMRALFGKTTVIPIISKADTLTAAHMKSLKHGVWASIQAAKLDPLEAMGLEDEEEEEEDAEDHSSEDASGSDKEAQSPATTKFTEYTSEGSYDDSSIVDSLGSRRASSTTNIKSSLDLDKDSKSGGRAPRRVLSPIPPTPTAGSFGSDNEPYLPFSVLSPDPYTLPQSLTRIFPWGEADPLNPLHCDFQRLKESVFGDWRGELRAASREKWYEGWRTSRLKRIPGGGIGSMRVRQIGGVTPVRSVPREGRTSPTSARKSSVGQEKSRIVSGHDKAEQLLGAPRGLAM